MHFLISSTITEWSRFDSHSDVESSANCLHTFSFVIRH